MTAAGSANDTQVGGSHYQKGDRQHWDEADDFDVPYLEGVASKYPLRWREKGGLEDLRKTLHYIDKIAESDDGHRRWNRKIQTTAVLIERTDALCRAHDCGPVEWRVVSTLLCGFTRGQLMRTRAELRDYIDQLEHQERMREAMRESIESRPERTHPGTPEDGGHHERQETEAVVPLNVGMTERHVHLHLPEGCSGELRQAGDLITARWGRL
jgi:hypothetical protein